MNNRFRVEYSNGYIGYMGIIHPDEYVLKVRVPYRNCFGKFKTKYIDTGSSVEPSMVSYITTYESLLNFLIEKFKRERNYPASKLKRIIKRRSRVIK